jgi:heterodisulfide reductase subunit C2
MGRKMVSINFEFRNEILKLNASLSYCYQCSTCSGGCPVAFLTEGRYNPRKIIEEAILGLEEKLITAQDPNVWLCSTCQKCFEECPQDVKLTEIFTLIKNRCFEKGNFPEAFLLQGKEVCKNGIAIPYSRAILSRREKFNLPEVNTIQKDELRVLMEETGFNKKLQGGDKRDEL